MGRFIHRGADKTPPPPSSDAAASPEGGFAPGEPHGGGGGSPEGGGRWKSALVMILLLTAVLTGLSLYAQKWKKAVWVREVVVTGNRLLSNDELMKRADGLVGKSLESVDSARLAARFAALPYVRNARVARELNGIVRIVLEERVPLARITDGGKVQVIDTEGYILPYRELPPPVSSLPPVSGVRKTRARTGRIEKADEKQFEVIKGMVEAVSASEYAGLLISGISLRDGNTTYLTAAGSPTRFIVGNDGNYKEKLKKFEIFWQKVVAKKGLDSYATVDLRFDERVFAVENP
ncbi:hypothetical protein CHL67_11675 [Prosthecochloris sp. GSB1]|uniref:cell division protein FtsQ/DivIB n=1 Tax=Prosthecochloris sp. GSB1 TaxID=281093 RepID=UPI000B8C7413|nr:FtsQ-type POTRA domain-containing protein [Prosthecochloris sp. GSB1]ASQ91497.1 hypothetical protein CHL67_11675 [Prosthecochloris sp. GSB1]